MILCQILDGEETLSARQSAGVIISKRFQLQLHRIRTSEGPCFDPPGWDFYSYFCQNVDQKQGFSKVATWLNFVCTSIDVLKSQNILKTFFKNRTDPNLLIPSISFSNSPNLNLDVITLKNRILLENLETLFFSLLT